MHRVVGSLGLALFLLLAAGRPALGLQQPAPAPNKSVAEWIKDLADPKAEVRQQAAQALAGLASPKTPDAEAPLREALKDKNGHVRVYAASALLRITPKSEQPIDVLAAAAADEDPAVAKLAIGFLAGWRPYLTQAPAAAEKVRSALVEALKAKDLGVRVAAANAFAPAYSFTFADPNPPDVAPVLAEGLAARDLQTKRLAVMALANLGPRARPALNALVKTLEDPDEFFRRHAAFALGRIGPDARQTVPALVDLLRDKSEGVRQLAAQALGSIGQEARAAVEPLRAALKDTQLGVRLSAAEALGRIGPAAKEAVPALADMLAKEERAVPQLGFPGRFPGWDPTGQAGFGMAMPRQLTSARAVVLEALGRLGPDAAAAAPILVKVRAPASVLAHIGKPAVPALVEGLRDAAPAVRLYCAVALGAIGPDAADGEPALAKALQDEDRAVRLQAIASLGGLGPAAKPAVGALVETLAAADNGEEIRSEAAQALGGIGPEAAAAVPALIEALRDKHAALHRWAAFGLGGIGPKAREAVSVLTDMLRDRHPYYRHAAATALRRIGEKSQAGDIPAEYRPTVAKGLDWLAKQQDLDGHWSAASGQYAVAITALSGLALLMDGSTPTTGRYAENLQRAVDWLARHSQNNGLIIDQENAGGTGLYLFGQGYAVLFLACVLDVDEDPARRRMLKDVLSRAVRFSESAQTTRGGWGYISAREGNDFDEGAATAVQVQSLWAASNAGIKIDAKVLVKTLQYLKNSTSPRGGVIYSLTNPSGEGRPALTAAALAGADPGNQDEEIRKKWWSFCKDIIPPMRAGRFGHDSFTNYYYAQAIYRLDEDGYAKLFPESKPDERLTWSRYRKDSFEYLKSTQRMDGSWSGSAGDPGPVYTTALHLAILQLDKRVLPLYQQQEPAPK
jgi:HEAT repeat protein